jgi:valyl-tRNA synthetase
VLTIRVLTVLTVLVAVTALAQSPSPIAVSESGFSWNTLMNTSTTIILAIIGLISYRMKVNAEKAAASTDKKVDKIGESVNGHTTLLENTLATLRAEVRVLEKEKARLEALDEARRAAADRLAVLAVDAAEKAVAAATLRGPIRKHTRRAR